MPVDFHDISVPLLTGEDNLDIWKSSLLDALEARGLDDYVLQVVPELTDAALAKDWHQERAMARHILRTTLMEPKIISLLKNNGLENDRERPQGHIRSRENHTHHRLHQCRTNVPGICSTTPFTVRFNALLHHPPNNPESSTHRTQLRHSRSRAHVSTPRRRQRLLPYGLQPLVQRVWPGLTTLGGFYQGTHQDWQLGTWRSLSSTR
ncbi:hypothetical protein QBC38DRAFT_152425 [Podospora fimiseda]|uniref:Uncharacterized protein n=1 Tax=Podospora fimiseda TaxID=252190 RepID=A0AAN6YKI6_9PEZI|nr:hypothetical protein QBC38DRAFT_152425 [Podospora fimiseda]